MLGVIGAVLIVCTFALAAATSLGRITFKAFFYIIIGVEAIAFLAYGA